MNKNLEAYYDAWDKFIKTWIVIKIKDPSCVFEWRLQVSKTAVTRIDSSLLYVLFLVICLKNLQAEIAMRAEGKPGMSDEEVRIPYPFYSRTSFLCYPTIFHCYKNGEYSDGVFMLQIKDFVSRYLPAYNAYLPTLYSEGPNGSDPNRLLFIEIDEERNPF